MRDKVTTALLALYILGSIYTFGYMFNRIECSEWRSSTGCADSKASGALVSAILWPLTLSVILQKGDTA